MTIALIDNGSLEAEAHRNLRAVADALATRAGHPVAAVSWKHSGRIPARALGGDPAASLDPWMREKFSEGEREFLFVPFFVSPQGAIGSALRKDLEDLRRDLGDFEYRFSGGLTGEPAPQGPSIVGQAVSSAGALAKADGLAPGQRPGLQRRRLGNNPLAIIASVRIRQALRRWNLHRPWVIVVDHGGPSPASAALRDAVADEIREDLAGAIGSLSAASMESPEGPEFAFNRPLLAELLAAHGYDRGEILISPLFLSPGRHAGPAGDLVRIARGAEANFPGLVCHIAELIGTHPLAAEILAGKLASELRMSPTFPVI